MFKRKKKFFAVFLGISLFAFVSGFCVDSLALADTTQIVQMKDFPGSMVHGKHVKNESEFSGHSSKNQVSPCCGERRSSIVSAEANNLQGKIVPVYGNEIVTKNFALNAEGFGVAQDSLAAPPGGGLVSSTIKLE